MPAIRFDSLKVLLSQLMEAQVLLTVYQLGWRDIAEGPTGSVDPCVCSSDRTTAPPEGVPLVFISIFLFRHDI